MKIDGEIFVIDTGSPVSFTFKENNTMSLKTLPFELPGNMLGIKKEEIEKLIGTELSGFIGLDLILRNGMTIDKGTGSVMFETDTEGMFYSFPVRFRTIHGIGLVDMECEINGKEVKAIFDTGASIGYVYKSLIGDSECIGEVTDYGPAFGGEIKTKKYKTSVSIGDFTTKTEMAKMTFAVEAEVGLLGYKAIFGLNDFEWERVVIDPENSCISFC